MSVRRRPKVGKMKFVQIALSAPDFFGISKKSYVVLQKFIEKDEWVCYTP